MDTPAERAIQLGAALRLRRKAMGINVTAAAEAAGMSRATWHRLEHGETGVAWGLLLAAAAALDLELRLLEQGDGNARPEGDAVDGVPLEIRLDDYPGLRRLAWQVGQGVKTLTPREALGLYERNARHLDEAGLPAHELSLLRALRTVFHGASP